MVSGILAGAGAGATVNIIINAIDNYSKEFSKLDSDIKKQNTTFNKLSGTLSKMGLGYTVLAGAAIGFGIDSVKTAIDSERAFQQFNLALGDTADLMLNDLRKASSGLVSDLNLVNSANRALALGIDKNQLPELMEVATARAKIFGRTTTEAFDDITIGIGRESRMILDNLGIIIDMDEAMGKYAESIGKTSEQLTVAERKQALVNNILKESEGLLKAQIYLIETHDEQLQRLGATYENTKSSVGRFALAYLDTNEYLYKFLTLQLDIEKDTPSWVKGIDNRAVAITELANQSKAAAQEMDAIRKAFQGITDTKFTGESEKDLEIAKKEQQINVEKLRLLNDHGYARGEESLQLIRLQDELEKLRLEREVEFVDVKKVAKANADKFIAEQMGIEVTKQVFFDSMDEKFKLYNIEKKKISEVNNETEKLIASYERAARARSGALGISSSFFSSALSSLKPVSKTQGSSYQFNIGQVNGINADDISRSLRNEINNQVSL